MRETDTLVYKISKKKSIFYIIIFWVNLFLLNCKKLNGGREIVTESKKFNNDDFFGCKTTGNLDSVNDGISSGGAINCYGNTAASLIIIKCNFTSCTAHYCGGAISVYNFGSVLVERNKFEDCTTSNYQGGGVFGQYIETCMKCSKNTFINCKSNDRGGGFFLQNFNITCNSNNPCISGCSFTKCKAETYYGGGIYIYYPPAEFKMQNTIFISCHANNWGGGILFQPYTNTINNSKLFFYCYFENNSSPKGNDLFFDEYHKETHTETPFLHSFSSSPEDRVWKRNLSAQKYYNVTWLDSGTLNRYISNVTGTDPEEGFECDYE